MENQQSIASIIPRSGLTSGVYHVIGFSDLADLWVDLLICRSFAHIVRRDHVNRARNANHAVKTCERFVYSIVKITRLYDYKPVSQSCAVAKSENFWRATGQST